MIYSISYSCHRKFVIRFATLSPRSITITTRRILTRFVSSIFPIHRTPPDNNNHSSFQKDHMSIEYVAESCSEILGIRADKAYDLSLFAKHQGFSTLGTWTREECLSMGEQLLSRNLDCRVIPFNGGVVDPESNRRLPPSEYAGDNNIMLTTSRPSGAIDTYYLV